MTKEFIPYQQGLQLKELGFDEPCWAWWHIEDCDTRFCYSDQRSPIINSRETEIVGLPTYSQAFRWFRENYKLHSYIHSDYSWNISGGIWDLNGHKGSRYDWDSNPHTTYEEAELDCLNKLIEIIDAKIKNR